MPIKDMECAAKAQNDKGVVSKWNGIVIEPLAFSATKATVSEVIASLLIIIVSPVSLLMSWHGLPG
jgi:hypothetical protein